MKTLFLGVDGGGTETRAVIINREGHKLGEGKAGGSNNHAVGEEIAITNLIEAIKQAIKGQRYEELFGCLSLAGVNSTRDQHTWATALQKKKFFSSLFSKPPLILNDTRAALRSGTTDKNAVVIIAGTGSNCYGINDIGEEAKTGGQDYILGDEGSGYFVGLEILKHVTRTLDEREDSTLLKDLLLNKLHVHSLDELASVVYGKHWGKTEVSSIASIIDQAVEKDDQTAKKIVEEAAHDLGIMIKTVIKKLGLIKKKATIVKAGGMFKNTLLSKLLENEVKKFTPDVTFIVPTMHPSIAAAFFAKEQFSW